MMREMWIRLLSCLFILGILLLPAESRVGVKGLSVVYSSGEETVTAELFLPDPRKFDPPYSALIAVHEWWGLNDQVRGEAKKLAAEGFAVLAVDLYRGRATVDAEEAHELMRGMPEDRARRDLKAAFDYLSKRPDVWEDKIGAIGWCMGGGYALELAAEEPKLAACVMYYGRLITDRKRLAQIRAPIYGFFGELDRGIPAKSVREFEKQMKKIGKNAGTTVRIYPNAGHAFANAARPSYNDTAAKDAWARTIESLKGDLDDVIMRVKKLHEHGDSCPDGTHKPGDRIVYTIWAENDGRGVPDSVTIIDELDSNMDLDLSSVRGYGDIFTDSAMPTWGGTFDVLLDYRPRTRKKMDMRKPKDREFRPLTRQTPAGEIGVVRWRIRFTGGDTSALAGRQAGSNPFLGPDNHNDDRRKINGVDTAFGAKSDADAAYVRMAVRVKRP